MVPVVHDRYLCFLYSCSDIVGRDQFLHHEVVDTIIQETVFQEK